MSSELLKQAIADAKAVRATALQNAKAALEEAFAPKLQSMLATKLQQEIEGEDDEAPVTDEVPVADAPVADEVPVEEPAPAEDFGGEEMEAPVADEVPVEEPVDDEFGGEEEVEEAVLGQGHPDPFEQSEELTEADDSDYKKMTNGHKTEDPQGASKEFAKGPGKADKNATAGEPKAQGEPSSAKAGHKTPDPQGASNEFSKGPGKADKDETGKVLEEDEEMEIEDGSLEEILKELEDEVNAVSADEFGQDDLPVAEDCGAEAVGSGSPAGEDEEINLDEILSEDTDEDEEEESDEGDDDKPAFLKENAALKAENEEYRKAVGFLRDRINEVNLLNAKLLYTNRLFKAASLSKEQKIKVIESFDLTKSVREAKLVYATLAESFSFGATKKPLQTSKKATVKPVVKAITEGLASKVVASTKPTKPVVLTEGAEMASRFQKLAGIRK